MHSKRAASFLILLPVLVFAQLHLPLPARHAAQASFPATSWIAGAPSSAASRAVRPGRPVATSAVLALGQNRTRQSFGHPRIGWETALNPIFLAAPTYGSGGYYAESVAVEDLNGDGKPDLVVAEPML